MTEQEQEQYTYHLGKMEMTVIPVYETQEKVEEILLKLMRADAEQCCDDQ